MSAYGRWMYGPWFWPPAADTPYGPIANPYYDPTCNLDDPATWQYQTDPFCEPEQIPGTPNISVGMEQFNDTPIVNGVGLPDGHAGAEDVPPAHPERGQRPLLQLPVVRRRPDDRAPTQRGRPSKPAELAAAQTDPVVFPTPDTAVSPAGPRLDPDRHRGRLPARSGRRRRPAGDHLDHRPDPLRRRQRGPALAAAGAGRAGRRDRRLLEVRRQDADPLQRRARGLPGPRARATTTTPAPRT